MSLITNNSLGNNVSTNATVMFSEGILIGTAPTGWQPNFRSEWIDIGGLSKLVVQCQSTDLGLTPDSTVGSVYVTIEIANGVYPNFLSVSSLGAFRLDKFIVPLTDNNAVYPSSQIVRELQANSKFVRILVNFLDYSSLVGSQYAKLYVNLLASS
jgi:hypothetical protein